MPAQLETQMEVALDRCIDRLLAGADWTETLPPATAGREDVASLMEVALQLVRSATLTAPIQAAQRARIWRRVEQKGHVGGRLRAIALYRLPYLPPLWIRPEAC